MRKKAAKRSRKRARAGKVRARAGRSRAKTAGGKERDAASRRFVNDLMVRGEAAKLDKKGKLPLHATHVIRKQDADGSVEVERLRFKAF